MRARALLGIVAAGVLAGCVTAAGHRADESAGPDAWATVRYVHELCALGDGERAIVLAALNGETGGARIGLVCPAKRSLR